MYNLTYWNSKVEDSTCVSKWKGRPQALAPLEEFFLVLVRIRLGLLEQDIADRFGLSCATASRIFATWINFLFLKVKEIPLWPPRDVVKSSTLKIFKDLYPTTRVVIDATEIFVEKPSLPNLQQMTFSNYKNNNTYKGLVGISPSGAITCFKPIFWCHIRQRTYKKKRNTFAS